MTTTPISKAKKWVRHLDKALLPSTLPHVREALPRYTKIVVGALTELRDKLVPEIKAALDKHVGKVAKADDPNEDDTGHEDLDWLYAEELAAGLDMSTLKLIIDQLALEGTEISQDTVKIALAQFGFASNDAMVNQADQRAADWAEGRAAEMVGMRYDAQGVLVESRDAKMRIDDATRNMLRDIIGGGLAAGDTVDEIGSDIYDAYAFSQDRASLIANTEVRRASNQGALASYQTVADAGVSIKKEWLVADSPCEICEDNSDDGAIPIDDDFSSGDDAPPGHPNCVVGSTSIRAVGPIEAVVKRWYSGQLVILKLASGKELSITPNHPVLSGSGFTAASVLRVGDNVVCGFGGVEGEATSSDEHEEQVETTAEYLADSFLQSERISASTISASATDFHGDCSDGDVAVIGTDSFLSDKLGTSLSKGSMDLDLVPALQDPSLLVGECPSGLFGGAGFSSTSGVVGRLAEGRALLGSERAPVGLEVSPIRCGVSGSELLALLRRCAAPPRTLASFGVGCPGLGEVRSLLSRSDLDASILEGLAKIAVSRAEFAGKFMNTDAAFVLFDRIVDIELSGSFSGHVYNFQTSVGWYAAESVILHNCQCTLIPVTEDDADTEEKMAKLRKDGPADEAPDDHGMWTTGGGGASGGQYSNIHSASDMLENFSDRRAELDHVVASVPGGKAAVEAANAKLAGSTDTDKLVSEGGFKNADGTWTSDRAAVHDQIINGMFSEKAVSDATPREGQKPEFNMLGGRGGSGKGWFTAEGKGGPLDGTKSIVIDSDAIKGKLPGYGGWNAASFHEESSEIADRALGIARQNGLNVTYDATMRTGVSSIQRAASFSAAGYKVNGYYMYSPPEQAAKQALQRYMDGVAKTGTGRYVNPAYTFNSRSNEHSFDSIIPKLDSYQVYDGRGKTPKLVSEREQEMKKSDKLSRTKDGVLPPEAFDNDVPMGSFNMSHYSPEDRKKIEATDDAIAARAARAKEKR